MKNFLIAILAMALLFTLILRQRIAGPNDPQPQSNFLLKPLETTPQALLVSRYAAVKTALTEATQTLGLRGASLGYCLIDPEGTVVVDVNAQTAFIPASTIKTLTTATALQRLGPDYRFSTSLRSTAPIVGGVLSGDILMMGEGDPLLGLPDLTKWAQTLKTRGLAEVNGRIIGDGRYFSGSLFNDFWNWGDIGNGYGSAVSGLNLEHNRFTVSFQGAATQGAAAFITSLLPEMPEVTLLSEVTTSTVTSGDQVMIYGGERTNHLTMRGTVPAGTETVVIGAVPDPAEFTAWHFRKALVAVGIAVLGPATAVSHLEENPIPNTTELLCHPSPPLLELITSIHATSDNLETECLYRKLGQLAGQAPNELIRSHWKAQGLDFIGLRMEDGCGLARADHIRPLDLARLQYLAAQGPQGAAYQASLLSEGPLRWKGGAMSSIRSYTGYITSADGAVFCFALMVNHFPDSKAVSDLQGTLVDLVSKL